MFVNVLIYHAPTVAPIQFDVTANSIITVLRTQHFSFAVTYQVYYCTVTNNNNNNTLL